MFAGIPLLFAAQQAAEGTVWLTMHGDHYLLNRLAVSAFLGIALVVWPTWLPFSLRLVEQDPTRRRGLEALFWAGGVVAACALVLLFRFQPMAQIAGHSIRYEYAGSGNAPGRVLYLGAYVVPTVVPFFVSTLRLARPLGIVLVLSLVASVIVQRDALTSVWCFFAAILSCLILIAVAREQHANAFARPTPGT
jgi:hypothetical protein